MKRIVWQMCWKYLLIFAVPVLAVVCLFLYNNANVYRATVSNLQLSVLSQMSGEIDVMINGLNSLSTQMAEREDVVDIQKLSDEEKCDILQMYDGGLPDGISLLYYFRRTNNIYFQDSILSYHEFEQSSFFDVSLNFMGFFTQLNKCSYSNFMPVDAKAKRGGVYSAALMAPVPAVTALPTGTVTFLINRTYFDRLADKYFGDIEPEIYILDAALNVIFDGGSLTGREELTDIVREKPLGVSDISLESGDYVLMRSVSTSHGLYYVVLADEGAFYDGSGRDGLMLIGVGLVYLLCVLLAFTITKHTSNEAALVEQRSRESESLLKKGREQIRELVSLRLLSGAEREGIGCLKTVLNKWDSAFPFHFFCVAVVAPTSSAALEETRAAVSAGFEKAVGAGRAVSAVIDRKEKKVAVIISTQDPELDRRALVSSVRAELGESLRGGFTAGVGGVYEGEMNIPVSYLEALTAEDSCENPVFDGWYIFCANGKTQAEPLPYADQALVEQSIRSGSADLSASVVRKAFEKIDRLPSKSVRSCLYYDMVNMMIRICENVGAPMSTEQISRITALGDPDIIRRDVTYTALSLTEYVRAQMDAGDPSPIKRSLVEYVQNNFMDSNLSLSRLAEEFDLSYAYVSKTFKNETGRSFQAYLTQLRIDYVKDRLINTGTPIKDIVLQSGYLDVANFTRKFKQIEGVTPGQFRELHDK